MDCFKLFGWSLLVFLSSSYGQTSIEVPSANFFENYAENVKVSGSVLAASHISSKLKYPSPDELFVYVPKETNELNVIISSIDGQYSADASISLSPDNLGWINLKIPSQYHEKFAKYLPNRLVALAFIDSEDIFGDYIQEIYPTSWGHPEQREESLFINSSGTSPHMTFSDLSGDLISTKCVKLNDNYTKVFNYKCDFAKNRVEQKVLVTFSPSLESTGKNYFIWNVNED